MRVRGSGRGGVRVRILELRAMISQFSDPMITSREDISSIMD